MGRKSQAKENMKSATKAKEEENFVKRVVNSPESCRGWKRGRTEAEVTGVLIKESMALETPVSQRKGEKSDCQGEGQ